MSNLIKSVTGQGIDRRDNEQRTLTGGVCVRVEARISHVRRAVRDRGWCVVAVEDVVQSRRLRSG